MWHITWLLESPSEGWRVGPDSTHDPFSMSVCLSANLHHHPTAHCLRFCKGGGALEHQSLTGRGCKPQTNYTPSPNTAGHITRKNILFDRVCRAGKYDTNSILTPPPFPFTAGENLTGAALTQPVFPVSGKFFKHSDDFLTFS